MATTTAQTTDITTVLGDLLREVPDLRVYETPVDTARVPCVVITQPTLTFNDPESTYCAAVWDFTLGVVTSRSSDREAQKLMSRYLLDIVQALSVDTVSGTSIFSIQPIDASPVAISISGAEMPGYQLRVRVRA